MDRIPDLSDQLTGLCDLASAGSSEDALQLACRLLMSATSGERVLFFLTDVTGQAVELAAAQPEDIIHRDSDARRFEIDSSVGSSCPLAQAAQTGRLLKIAGSAQGYDFSRIEGLIEVPGAESVVFILPLRGKQSKGLLGIAIVTTTGRAEIEPPSKTLIGAVTDVLELQARADRQATELRLVRNRLEIEEQERRAIRQRQTAGIEAKLVGHSALMRTARDRLVQLASKDHAVLILGEQGSGKERAAREMHRLSRQRNGNFVYFDCASVPALALISELCGYKRGAIPGQVAARRGLLREAAGGTLYLDRVDLVPSEAQLFLGRLLETGSFRTLGSERDLPIDARLIFAALPNFAQRAEIGSFLPSLSFALLRHVLRLPALSDRREDIGFIVEAILQRIPGPAGEVLELSHSALAALHSLDYPGNIRQLEALIERAVGLTSDTEKALTSAHVEAARSGHQGTQPAENEGLREAVARFEADLVRRALHHCNGDRTRAAELLQIPKRTLADKCIRYAL